MNQEGTGILDNLSISDLGNLWIEPKGEGRAVKKLRAAHKDTKLDGDEVIKIIDDFGDHKAKLHQLDPSFIATIRPNKGNKRKIVHEFELIESLDFYHSIESRLIEIANNLKKRVEDYLDSYSDKARTLNARFRKQDDGLVQCLIGNFKKTKKNIPITNSKVLLARIKPKESRLVYESGNTDKISYRSLDSLRQGAIKSIKYAFIAPNGRFYSKDLDNKSCSIEFAGDLISSTVFSAEAKRKKNPGFTGGALLYYPGKNITLAREAQGERIMTLLLPNYKIAITTTKAIDNKSLSIHTYELNETTLREHKAEGEPDRVIISNTDGIYKVKETKSEDSKTVDYEGLKWDPSKGYIYRGKHNPQDSSILYNGNYTVTAHDGSIAKVLMVDGEFGGWSTWTLALDSNIISVASVANGDFLRSRNYQTNGANYELVALTRNLKSSNFTTINYPNNNCYKGSYIEVCKVLDGDGHIVEDWHSIPEIAGLNDNQNYPNDEKNENFVGYSFTNENSRNISLLIKHGHGTLYDAHQNYIFSGEWFNDRPYTGYAKDLKLEKQFYTGRIVNGEFDDHVAKLIEPGVFTYTGSIKNSSFHGQGRFETESKIIEGEFKDNRAVKNKVQIIRKPMERS